MAIGKFQPVNLEDYLADPIQDLIHNVATWMREYSFGSEEYPTLIFEQDERDFDIIAQGVKVVNLLRQAVEQIHVLDEMVDEADEDEADEDEADGI